ncbi:hypothetical protein G3N97_12215 [Paraburkholderia sp. Ac-20347]|nr:hypothetical protein [Paraburkholderia sp. Ac-20347]
MMTATPRGVGEQATWQAGRKARSERVLDRCDRRAQRLAVQFAVAIEEQDSERADHAIRRERGRRIHAVLASAQWHHRDERHHSNQCA